MLHIMLDTVPKPLNQIKADRVGYHDIPRILKYPVKWIVEFFMTSKCDCTNHLFGPLWI